MVNPVVQECENLHSRVDTYPIVTTCATSIPRGSAISQRETTLRNLTLNLLPIPGESIGTERRIPFGQKNLYHMDETHPQDRVQAAKEHLKGAVDDLHSAAKAKAAEFQHVVEDAWSDA
jgi:hypothetical protein